MCAKTPAASWNFLQAARSPPEVVRSWSIPTCECNAARLNSMAHLSKFTFCCFSFLLVLKASHHTKLKSLMCDGSLLTGNLKSIADSVP